MNKAAWDALDDQNKAILEASCGQNIYVNYAETEAMNPAAMNKMLEEYGVTNVRWTDEELAAFEKAWNEVLEEQSASRRGLQEDRRQLPTRSARSTRPGATRRP